MVELPEFTRDATFQDLLAPAMEIANARNHEAAERYVKAYKAYLIECWERTPEDADSVIRSNLGYYAGYYDSATRQAVQEVFGAAHPIFGSYQPTQEEAFDAGAQAAMGIKWTPPDA